MKRRLVTNKHVIDGITLEITEQEKELFDFLVENGFFREVGHCEYLSLTPSRSNSLNGVFQTTSVSSDGVQLSSTPNSTFSLGSLQDLKPSRFLTLMLSLILRVYFPNLILNSLEKTPWRSEATNTERSGARGRGFGGMTPRSRKLKLKEEITYEADPNPTEGSMEFDELDRNELLPTSNDVKRNRKTESKSDTKSFEIDPILEAVAIEWSAWSSAKAPWYKEKFTPDKFFVGLTKLKEAVQYEGKPLTSEAVREVFMFIKQDQFWKDQALSPRPLLTLSKNGVRKIDNILLSIKKKITRNNPLQGIDLEQAPF